MRAPHFSQNFDAAAFCAPHSSQNRTDSEAMTGSRAARAQAPPNCWIKRCSKAWARSSASFAAAGSATIDGLLRLVQRRFDSQPKGDNLGVQGQPARVQIRLDGIRGTKIRHGAGGQQPEPPLGVLLSLSLRSSRGRDLRTRSVLRTDYHQRQEQTRQEFHRCALTRSPPEVYHSVRFAENTPGASV